MNENIRVRLNFYSILYTILFAFLALYSLLVVKYQITLVNEEFGSVILVITFFVVGLFSIIKCVNYINSIIDINKNPLIKKYGSIDIFEKIIEEINNTIIYEDKKIIISNNYISAKSSYSKIFHLDDVINAYQFVQKTNGFETGRDLVIITRNGKEIHIAYRFYEDDLTRALTALAIHRNDIKIGYIR